MKGLGLALAMVIACAASLWWLSSDEGTASSPAPNRGHPAPAASTSRRPVLPTRSTTVPEIQERAPDRPTMDQEASITQQSALLETRFVTEPADVRWASDTSRMLTDDMQKAVTSDVRVDRIECRATLCRAELAMSSLETGNAFLEVWMRQTAWPGAALFAPDPETKRMIIYLGKAGTTLAQAD